MNQYQYSIIRLSPDHVKGEIINVGIIIYLNESLDIRTLQQKNKIQAITKNLTLESLQNFTEDLNWLYQLNTDSENFYKLFSGSIIISSPGRFTLSGSMTYEKQVDILFEKYITSPRLQKRNTQNKRIITQLKNIFDKAGILGRDLSDISKHRVVTNYPIAEGEGIYAELLLKNGAYHLTETLDLRTDNNKQKTGESALKAITISKAKSILSGNVNSFVIYASVDSQQDKKLIPQLNLIDNYADSIFNINSKEDMSSYYDHIFNAAGTQMKNYN